jgi:hypothetical protein
MRAQIERLYSYIRGAGVPSFMNLKSNFFYGNKLNEIKEIATTLGNDRPS